MNKRELREKIAALRKNASEEALRRRSEAIQRKLEETALFKQARCIALYYATSGEVGTRALIDKWHGKKKIALPAVSGESMDFYLYDGERSVAAGAFGIMEPTSKKRVAPEKIDLVVVPGVAFDRNMNRMGRGKGFYDRFLARTNAPAIGICFGFQLFDEIPAEPHDKKMTMVITENATLS